jgi:hypothetical protein
MEWRMSPTDPASFHEGKSPVPVSIPEALDFPIPAACEAGFASNVRLLEQHWTVLRKARDLIASGADRA